MSCIPLVHRFHHFILRSCLMAHEYPVAPFLHLLLARIRNIITQRRRAWLIQKQRDTARARAGRVKLRMRVYPSDQIRDRSIHPTLPRLIHLIARQPSQHSLLAQLELLLYHHFSSRSRSTESF
ncbi:hypothetical protein Mapa_011220 [Marchantia paleacea]|nr:hypothetical protein Mapa_011220 [Marchantia paleacea]